uniref:Major facilitator superfamily (MFS) profile domain-containing protein n=1 Tax=Aegilops tauschii subsp. strangulata TaxID=200361 RepID=A0A452YSN0_AEGTS
RLAIMAFNQTRPYFYAFYIAKTLTAMVSEGAMMCLSLAYVVTSSIASLANFKFFPIFPYMTGAQLDAMHGLLSLSPRVVQADKVPEGRRAAAFGVFSGVCTAGFVGGTIAARFLSVSSTFQVCLRAPRAFASAT